MGRAGLQGAPLMVPYFHLNTSQTQEDLEVQVTLVENLRRYVGEQVPPEVHSQTWESERQELLETMQVRKCRVHVWGVRAGREAGIPGEGWPLGRAASYEGANRPLSCWQHLQEDRAGLHTTAGLLEVRVQSLTHILSLQEQELARKVGRASLWGGAGGLEGFPSLNLLRLLLPGQHREKPKWLPPSSAPPGAHTVPVLRPEGSAFRFPGA